MPEPRRTFGPVLLPGVLAAALGALACAKTWAALGGSPSAVTRMGTAGGATLTSAGQVPLASALSLVALAAWGALLVTRGRARQVFAALGLAAALVLLVVTVRAAWSAPDAVRTAVERELGLGNGKAGNVPVDLTGWYWTALVAVLVTVVAFAFAVRLAPHWPAMAARYDAPGGGPVQAEPRTNQEIWKAIDEGHDPTE